MDRAKLRELADRVEAASGPDRELDAAINYELKPEYAHMRGTIWHIDDLAPPYTASLDVAMTLGDEVCVLISLSEIKGDGMPMCIVGNPGTSELFEAVAETMPLAACAARLRAIASQEQGEA